jgi:hypothetical protein
MCDGPRHPHELKGRYDPHSFGPGGKVCQAHGERIVWPPGHGDDDKGPSHIAPMIHFADAGCRADIAERPPPPTPLEQESQRMRRSGRCYASRPLLNQVAISVCASPRLDDAVKAVSTSRASHLLGSQLTLNKRVQGSSPCAPTKSPSLAAPH